MKVHEVGERGQVVAVAHGGVAIGGHQPTADAAPQPIGLPFDSQKTKTTRDDSKSNDQGRMMANEKEARKKMAVAHCGVPSFKKAQRAEPMTGLGCSPAFRRRRTRFTGGYLAGSWCSKRSSTTWPLSKAVLAAYLSV